MKKKVKFAPGGRGKVASSKSVEEPMISAENQNIHEDIHEDIKEDIKQEVGAPFNMILKSKTTNDNSNAKKEKKDEGAFSDVLPNPSPSLESNITTLEEKWRLIPEFLYVSIEK